jgi:hypothetical protein
MGVAAIFPVLVSLVTAASVTVQPKSITRWWIPQQGSEFQLVDQVVVCLGMVPFRRLLTPDALASKDIQKQGGPDKKTRVCLSFYPGQVVRAVKSSPAGVCLAPVQGKLPAGFECGWVQNYSLPDTKPLEAQ